MRPQTKVSVLLLLFSMSFSFSSAQTIGDEALQRAQSGDVSFVEGEFIAYLADTVSPGFVESSLANNGFEIAGTYIKPVKIRIQSRPDSSTLSALSSHPLVKELTKVSPKIDTVQIRNELASMGIPMSQRSAALQRMINAANVPQYHITFQFAVNETKLKEVMGEFRNVAYEILQNYPRTVNIKTEPGKEPDVMEQVEGLPFVETTAMIAILEE
jgi:hypothetical protein